MREMYHKDRTVLEVDPLHLSGMLKDEGYFNYYASLVSIGALEGWRWFQSKGEGLMTHNAPFRGKPLETRVDCETSTQQPVELHGWQSIDAGARGDEPDYFAPDMNTLLRELWVSGYRGRL